MHHSVYLGPAPSFGKHPTLQKIQREVAQVCLGESVAIYQLPDLCPSHAGVKLMGLMAVCLMVLVSQEQRRD